jgi:hypothetical protein
MYIELHIEYPLLFSDFNEIWIFSTDFRKIIIFNENPSSGSRIVTCVRRDMTKLIVAFRNSVNLSKNVLTSHRMCGTALQYGDQLPFSVRTNYRRSNCIHDLTACSGKLKFIQEFFAIIRYVLWLNVRLCSHKTRTSGKKMQWLLSWIFNER